MPEPSTIVFDKKDKGAIAFTKQYFENLGIEYKIQHNKLLTKFSFTCDEILRVNLLAEIILIFYKSAEVLSVLPKGDSVAHAAFVGSVMSIERESEKKSLIAKIMETNEIFSVEGFYNFCLDSFREVWKNLAKLSQKLYKQCKNGSDMIELTTFMLGIEGGQSVAVIDNSNKTSLRIDKFATPVAELFEKAEQNLIASVLMHHPENIIITRPDKLPAELMGVIKSLGE